MNVNSPYCDERILNDQLVGSADHLTHQFGGGNVLIDATVYITMPSPSFFASGFRQSGMTSASAPATPFHFQPSCGIELLLLQHGPRERKLSSTDSTFISMCHCYH